MRQRYFAGRGRGAAADHAGITTSAFSKLEQGIYEPSWSTVQSLARALGVTTVVFEESGPAEEEKPAAKKGKRKK
jgi:transcriptional regulator with XRE-family HTH domain